MRDFERVHEAIADEGQDSGGQRLKMKRKPLAPGEVREDEPRAERSRWSGETERQLPRWSELRELIRPRPVSVGVAGRLARAQTIEDLRAMAKRRAPRAVFDFVDGGAGDELSTARARGAFARVEYHPRVLRDVSNVSLSTTILGENASMPLVLAPTGFTRMMHRDGESAVAAAGARAGVPYTLSTAGTTSPEELMRVDPPGERWFQLYLWEDRRWAEALLDRIARAGFRTLVLTADVPVAGDRRRDIRNGLEIPPTLSLASILEGALHPRWWFDFLTTEPIRFGLRTDPSETLGEARDRMFNPTLAMDDLAWLRERWTAKLVVKGVMRVDDAREIASADADGIVVSNHGGRQLDRAATPLEVLPSIVEAVGDRLEVFVDGGVRSGADVVAAVGLGARAVLVGRAYLYGLMAGGERGVARALSILREDAVRTLQLLGARSVDELDASLVALR
jgi:L-lactate dehydrogenase (cytochrome)